MLWLIMYAALQLARHIEAIRTAKYIVNISVS